MKLNIKTLFYISVHLLDIGPLTFTDDDTKESTLIGILSGNGDETSCKGTTAFGRLSTSDTLNWIKQNIKGKVHIQVLKKIKLYNLLYYIANYIILIIFFNML